MADHPDDIRAAGEFIFSRLIGGDPALALRAILHHMAGVRASATYWASEFRRVQDEGQAFAKELHNLRTLRPRDEWGESDGVVLWWRLPIVEPPYAGDPREDDFPEGMTHWTPMPKPVAPAGTKETS